MGRLCSIPREREPGAGGWLAVRDVGLVLFIVAGGVALAGCSREAPRGGPIDVVVGFGESGNAPGQFGYPRAIDRDESGDVDTIWVIDKLARVQRIDAATGRALEDWRMPKFENGKPTGVTVWEGAGRGGERTSERANEGKEAPLLFVADTHEHRVVVFAIREARADGETITERPPIVATFGSYGEGDGEMVYPTDVCVVPTQDGRGIARVFVSEYGGNDRVSIWEPASESPSQREGFGVGEIPATSESVATEVADSPTPGPSLWEGGYSNWKFVGSFGTFGDSASKDNVQFSRPQTMSLTDDGSQLIIADACNHRVGVFTLEGELVRWIATRGPGAGPGQLAYPYAISTLGDGTIMVAEYGNNRLQRLDLATGDSLGIFGQAGRGKGQLSTPWSMTRVGDLLYVLDSGNSRVVALDVPRGRPDALTGGLASTQGDEGAGGAR
jgi:hypothetical protein